MNKIEGELISALLDDEIEPEKYRNMVSRLIDAGPEALDTYGRYRLIGDLMRDETAQVVDVADAVHDALRDEPTVLVPRPQSAWRWLKPAAGVAVAASVAAGAVVIAPKLIPALQTDFPAVPVMTELPRSPSAPTFVATQPLMREGFRELPPPKTGGRWRALDPALEERLNRLVIEHHEYAGRTGLHGPVSHIGVASYEGR